MTTQEEINVQIYQFIKDNLKIQFNSNQEQICGEYGYIENSVTLTINIKNHVSDKNEVIFQNKIIIENQ